MHIALLVDQQKSQNRQTSLNGGTNGHCLLRTDRHCYVAELMNIAKSRDRQKLPSLDGQKLPGQGTGGHRQVTRLMDIAEWQD